MPDEGEPPTTTVMARGLLPVLCAAVLVDTVFFTALTPLLPHYAHVLRLSKAGAGLLVGAYPLGTLLGALPGGVVATRLGVRPAVVAGLAVMSLSTVAFGFGTSVAVCDGARFAQGVAGACTWAGALAWLAAAAPVERRGRVLGLAFAAAVGGSLAGPLVGAVASRAGTGPTFAAAAVAGTLLLGLSLALPRPPAGEAQALGRAVAALGDGVVARGLWLTTLAGLAFGVVDVLVPLRLHDLGASAVVIGGAFLGAAAVEGVLSPVVGRLADRRGPLLPVRVSLVVGVVVALSVPVLAPAAALVGVLVVGLPSFGALFVPASTMVSAGAEGVGLHQGLAFGLANLAWAAGQGLAAVAGGALAGATDDAVPFAVLAAGLVATAVVLRPRPPRRVWSTGAAG